VLKGIEGDKGLVIKDPAAHHAISAKFPKAIDNKGKQLVVQYEVKLQSEYLQKLPLGFGRALTATQTASSAVVPT
jgi:hypothetical protein